MRIAVAAARAEQGYRTVVEVHREDPPAGTVVVEALVGTWTAAAPLGMVDWLLLAVGRSGKVEGKTCPAADPVEEGEELIRIEMAQQRHSGHKAAADNVAADLVGGPVALAHTGLLVLPTVEGKGEPVVRWKPETYSGPVEATALRASEAEAVVSRGHRAEETGRCSPV